MEADENSTSIISSDSNSDSIASSTDDEEDGQEQCRQRPVPASTAKTLANRDKVNRYHSPLTIPAVQKFVCYQCEQPCLFAGPPAMQVKRQHPSLLSHHAGKLQKPLLYKGKLLTPAVKLANMSLSRYLVQQYFQVNPSPTSKKCKATNKPTKKDAAKKQKESKKDEAAPAPEGQLAIRTSNPKGQRQKFQVCVNPAHTISHAICVHPFAYTQMPTDLSICPQACQHWHRRNIKSQETSHQMTTCCLQDYMLTQQSCIHRGLHSYGKI